MNRKDKKRRWHVFTIHRDINRRMQMSTVYANEAICLTLLAHWVTVIAAVCLSFFLSFFLSFLVSFSVYLFIHFLLVVVVVAEGS